MRLDAFDACFIQAVRFRSALIQEPNHNGAFRLFNGFTEGIPELVVDVLAKTAVIHDYSDTGMENFQLQHIQERILDALPFCKAIVLKFRRNADCSTRNGQLLYGVKADERICEYGITYAVDLFRNRDNSFYADTRFLRKYLLETSRDKRVLNTFAYTGSLGVAAFAGGAADVVQTDLSGKFLELGQRSCHCNAIHFDKHNFMVGNFFPVVAKLKKAGALFDMVILDPPFFSKTDRGVVDLANEPLRLINKLRPRVADDGQLIVVNNSLFLSGMQFLNALDSICDGEYLTRTEIIPIPEDFTGFDPEYQRYYQVDPYPFNHPTKIVVLKVKRK